MKLSNVCNDTNLGILENEHGMNISNASIGACINTILMGLSANELLWKEFDYTPTEVEKLKTILNNSDGMLQLLEILIIENQQEWDDNSWKFNDSDEPDFNINNGTEINPEDKPNWISNDTNSEYFADTSIGEISNLNIQSQFLDVGQEIEGTQIDCIIGECDFEYSNVTYIASFKYYEDDSMEIVDIESDDPDSLFLCDDTKFIEKLESEISEVVNKDLFNFEPFDNNILDDFDLSNEDEDSSNDTILVSQKWYNVWDALTDYWLPNNDAILDSPVQTYYPFTFSFDELSLEIKEDENLPKEKINNLTEFGSLFLQFASYMHLNFAESFSEIFEDDAQNKINSLFDALTDSNQNSNNKNFWEYVKSLIGEDRFYKLNKISPMVNFVKEYSRDIDNYPEKWEIIQKIVGSQNNHSCWTYFNKLTKSFYVFTDESRLVLSKEKIDSKFENEKPGYIGKYSGDLIVKYKYTMIFVRENLIFETTSSENISTNGFF